MSQALTREVPIKDSSSTSSSSTINLSYTNTPYWFTVDYLHPHVIKGF